MKTCYYYQTFCGLKNLLNKQSDLADIIIISSIHFGIDNQNNPYIHLNDNIPENSQFDTMWKETEELSSKCKIMLMIGGAGDAYNVLFKNFNIFYPLLEKLIKSKKWITGIDLDIEESVNISNIKMLILKIKESFGKEFQISMAPVCYSLINDEKGMGNFVYKELYNSEEGKQIDWFNVQSYGGSFNFSTFDKIVKNGYPESKINLGMMSGDFTKDTFSNAINEIKKIKSKYPDFYGVFDWEYLDAPPNTDQSDWCKLIKNA